MEYPRSYHESDDDDTPSGHASSKQPWEHGPVYHQPERSAHVPPVVLFDRALEAARHEMSHAEDDDDDEEDDEHVHAVASQYEEATAEHHAAEAPATHPESWLHTEAEHPPLVVPGLIAPPELPHDTAPATTASEHAPEAAHADDAEGILADAMGEQFMAATSGERLQPLEHVSEPATLHEAPEDTLPTDHAQMPPRPPVPPAGFSYNQPPMPPVPPTADGGYHGFPSPDAYPSSPPMPQLPRIEQATEDHSDALRRAEQHGQRRGVAAGLVAGWWARGRFAKRRAAKVERQHAQAQTEQQKSFDTQFQSQEARMRHLRQQNEALQHTMQTVGQRQRFETPFTSEHAQPTQRHEAVAARPMPARPEQTIVQPQHPAEVQPQPENTDRQQPSNEQQPTQPDHYVQASWVNIGVDKRGNVVEGQEFGRAFHEEQAAEQAGNRYGTDQQQQYQQQGGPAGSATTAYGYPNEPRLMSGQASASQGLAPGQLPADPQHRLPAKPTEKTAVSLIRTPWFWLLAGIVILAFFIAALA